MNVVERAMKVGVAPIAVLLAGCGVPQMLLNPDFATSVGLAPKVAAFPGEAPSVLVEVSNATGHTLEFLLTWRDADGNVVQRTGTLAVGDNYQEAVICPVQQVTLGDVGNLTTTGAVVRLGNGGPNDPLVEVEPFGVLMEEGVNYNCGDAVTFSVQTSGATLSGYQVFAFIRRSGTGTTP